MPPSRSGVPVSVYSSYPHVILIVSTILILLPIHHATADHSLESHPLVPFQKIDTPGKAIMEALLLGRYPEFDRMGLPRLDPESVYRKPFPRRPMSFETSFPSLWPGDDLLRKIVKATSKLGVVKKKRSSSSDSDKKSAKTVKRRTRASASVSQPPVPVNPSLYNSAMFYTGEEKQTGRFAMDLFLPAHMGTSSLLFLESRAGYEHGVSELPGAAHRRVDLDLGLGLRKVWDDRVMVGTNTFLDTSRLYGEWSFSPGFGVEFAWAPSGLVWDTALNVYRGGGIDLKSSLTFPIVYQHLDMRLYAEKYRFFDGDFILGSKGGVEISLSNRLLAVSYEYGQDSRNPKIQAVACSLSVPFSVEKIFSGENPFGPLEHKSRAARYAQRLKSDRVKRTWSSPATVVEARHTPQGKRWTTPGRLTDTTLWSTKESPDEDKSRGSKRSKDTCRECNRCCEREEEEGSSLGAWLVSTRIGQVICAVGATYLGCDYAYRNAFGPFELEPYEIERIRKEMPKRLRRR